MGRVDGARGLVRVENKGVIPAVVWFPGEVTRNGWRVVGAEF